MKKRELNQKLFLNKKVISRLSQAHSAKIVGGDGEEEIAISKMSDCDSICASNCTKPSD